MTTKLWTEKGLGVLVSYNFKPLSTPLVGDIKLITHKTYKTNLEVVQNGESIGKPHFAKTLVLYVSYKTLQEIIAWWENKNESTCLRKK